MRGMHPLPAISKVVLDVYNFSIISNLFDSDTLVGFLNHPQLRTPQYKSDDKIEAVSQHSYHE